MAINYLNSIDLNQNELRHAQIENQASDALAGTGVEGQLYFNTQDSVLKVWAGGGWSSISGDITSVTAGNYLNGGGSIGDITINHDATTRADTTSTPSQLAFGDTFDSVTSVTTNSYGHVTAINVATYELPDSDNVTYTLPVNAGGGNSASIELVRGGAGSGVAGAVVIQGTTNEIEITETTGSFGSITIGLPDDVTIAGELTVAGTGQSSFAGQVTIPQTPSADTDAASKHYVDQAVTGALSYQGGYNASTNTPNLDSNPSPNPIKTGWTYTVTADGLFFTEQVRVGDVLIAENDAPTTLAEWTTVQNNVDLADLTTVGIGNVNPGEAIDVSYSNGTATVSVEDSTATNKGAVIVAPGVGMSVAYSNGTATVTNTQTNSANTYAVTITDTATVTHNLGTKDVIIQLYDVTTDETVYADVERASINTAAIAFASTPTNSIRVLVQKIG